MPSEIFFGRLKVKVTLEGHINKLVRTINPNLCMYFKLILHRCTP